MRGASLGFYRSISMLSGQNRPFNLFRSGAKALGLLLVLAFLAGLTGCVSMDQYKGLQTAHEQALEQLAQAQHDLELARQQIEQLNAKIADLNNLLSTGASGDSARQREIELLRAQLADLQNKYNDLLKMSATPNLPVAVNNALKDLAAQYPDLLEYDERLGMLRLKSDLTFDVGSTEVRPQAKQALAKVAQILNMPEIARNEVQVVGHTDDIPIRAGGPTATRNPDNWTLSTNRAWSVLAVLHTNGLSDDRGTAGGWGDQRPIAPNAANKRGNEKNRRVEIYIRPTTVPEGIVVSTGAASTPTPVAPRRTAPRTPRTPATRPAAPAATAPTPPMPM